MTWHWKVKNGIPFYSSSLMEAEDWLEHGVTPSSYTQGYFNLGFNRGEDEKIIIERREKVAQAFSVEVQRLVCVRQVHSDRVIWVDEKVFSSGIDYVIAQENADGLVTALPDVLLATSHADCVPILLADPEHRVVAVIHAGWKGTASAIVINALELMKKHVNTCLSRCTAAIGPSASGCCYQVGEELEPHFKLVLKRVGLGFSTRLDLPEINQKLLFSAGLRASAVDKATICTICGDEPFFSHRRQGEAAGRMLSLIKIKKF
jgi:YfiH family protein